MRSRPGTFEGVLIQADRQDNSGLRVGDSPGPDPDTVSSVFGCRLGRIASTRILGASIRLQRGKIIGSDPLQGWASGTLQVDLAEIFGSSPFLQLDDMQSSATVEDVAESYTVSSEYLDIQLKPDALPFLTLVSQFRVWVTAQTDGDSTAELMTFYGNAAEESKRPVIEVTYESDGSIGPGSGSASGSDSGSGSGSGGSGGGGGGVSLDGIATSNCGGFGLASGTVAADPTTLQGTLWMSGTPSDPATRTWVGDSGEDDTLGAVVACGIPDTGGKPVERAFLCLATSSTDGGSEGLNPLTTWAAGQLEADLLDLFSQADVASEVLAVSGGELQAEPTLSNIVNGYSLSAGFLQVDFTSSAAAFLAELQPGSSTGSDHVGTRFRLVTTPAVLVNGAADNVAFELGTARSFLAFDTNAASGSRRVGCHSFEVDVSDMDHSTPAVVSPDAVISTEFQGTGAQGSCTQYGVYEVDVRTSSAPSDPFRGLAFSATFVLPSGTSEVSADGFYDGVVDGMHSFKIRAYCGFPGTYSWRTTSSFAPLNGLSGTFLATADSALKGKIRHSESDPFQMQYDDGDWFLHLGDTGYRYLSDTEPEWKAYIDQTVGVLKTTKIRAWVARARRTVGDLFLGKGMNVNYWQAMESRILYALQRYPHVQLQIMPFAKDEARLKEVAAGSNALARYMPSYAQARWSSFSNVHWCISNDLRVPAAIRILGADMAMNEPWGTLITNHQVRGTGYDFVEEPWSGLVTLETLDELEGAAAIKWRQEGTAAGREQPVILDEDRYEYHRTPAGDLPTWFRRYMWSNLAAGAHPTYGGARVYELYQTSQLSGVRGYQDLADLGRLEGGRDFHNIPFFFEDFDLVGTSPELDRCGGNGARAVCSFGSGKGIVYVHPSAANSVVVNLPVTPGRWAAHCFDVVKGIFHQSYIVNGGGPLLLDCSSESGGDVAVKFTLLV